MYKIQIDTDIIEVENRIHTATELIGLVGEEPTDCFLVSKSEGVVFHGKVDLERHKAFETLHEYFIPSYWIHNF